MLKLKTLVVVHKTFLQNQWYDRIKEFTDCKIGLIRQKKVDVENKDIVIAMLQSISMIDYDDSIFKDFGLVIFDEVHHTGSRVFCNSLKKLCTRYTLGLSATLYRNDGLTKVIKWYLGEVIYKEERKNDIQVNVKSIYFKSKDPLFKEKKRWINGGIKADMVKMITNFCKVKDKNNLFKDIIRALRHQKDRKILFLSGRIEHLENMKKLVDEDIKLDEKNGLLDIGEQTTSLYIGKMKEYELNDAVEADIIFASIAMAEEGLDIPQLNTLIFGCTKKSIEQCVGRILRKKDSDKLIIDVIDNISRFINQGNSRKKFYKKNKYLIEEYIYENNQFISNHEKLREQLGLTVEEFAEEFSDTESTPTEMDVILKINNSSQCDYENNEEGNRKINCEEYMFS